MNLAYTFEQIILEKLKFYNRVAVSAHLLQNTQVHTYLNMAADNLVATLGAVVAGQTEVEVAVTFPITWWDAVKDHWLPAWAKTRWPPQYRHIRVDKATVYPSFILPPEQFGRPVVILTKRDWSSSYSPTE